MEGRPRIFIVEDDPAVTQAIVAVARLLDVPWETFTSAEEFLRAYQPDFAGCLLLDYRLPGRSGLDLQRQLKSDGCLLPVIVMSGHGGISTAVEAMHQGAMTYLEKPLQLKQLRNEIERAMCENTARRQEAARLHAAQQNLASLTDKELEVLRLLARGLSNKEIASELHKSVRAIEDRRSRMMRKLANRSLPEAIEGLLLVEGLHVK